MSALYVFAPDHLSFEQGGYLKQRFALLLPLLLLAFLKEPRWAVLRGLLWAATFLIVAQNAHRIDSRRAPHRHVAGTDTNDHEDDCNERIRYWISRTDLKQKSA